MRAPVVGLDFPPIHQLDQPFHITQFRLGKAFGEPVGLFPEVTHLFELFHRQGTGLVGGLAAPGDVTACPGAVIPEVALLFTAFDEAASELIEQIRLLDQVAAGFCKGCKAIHRLFQLPVGFLLLFPRLLLFRNGPVKTSPFPP